MKTGPGGFDGQGAVAAVAAGRASVAELLNEARATAERWEPWLGAVVTWLDRPSPATSGPLAGVVAGVKDVIAVRGVTRRAGAPSSVAVEPQSEDAAAVASLFSSGASLLATLETHPLAFGVVTPQTRNPRAPDRIAGGSSGGPAAALATGSVHAALGTDTGGSVRGPASCCGVVGLKTTRGLVPLTGVQELAWSLDTVGPMAATVADVALVLRSIIGHDIADPVSIAHPSMVAVPDRNLRIGIPRELDQFPIDPDVIRVWRSVVDALGDAGHELHEVSLPSLVDAPPANGLILCAEAAAIHRGLLERRPEAIHPLVDERLQYGAGLLATEVADARRIAVQFSAQVRVVFDLVDVLCTPTLPCRVPKVGQTELVVEGQRMPTTLAMTKLTSPWNLIGIPAGSVPGGLDAGGAPVGIQMAGPAFSEHLVLRAMAVVADLCGGPMAPEPPPAASA